VQFNNEYEWVKELEGGAVRIKKVSAPRGNIYAEKNNNLALTIPFYRVAIDPSISTKSDRNEKIYKDSIRVLCQKLSGFFGDKSADQYYRMINDSRQAGTRQYLLLNRQQINHHEKKRMETWPIFNHASHIGGVIFEEINNRFNPHNLLARRTIGDTKEEVENGLTNMTGMYGIEYSFDEYLRGKDGTALYVKIGPKEWKKKKTKEEVEPVPGYDVHTTLDIDLQDVVEETLLAKLKEHQADNGCVLVMEVATGDIKAIANLDKVTRTNRNTGEKSISYREIYNYAVGKRTEPGSTFKLASLMAVLEKTNLSPEDSIDTGNGIHKFSDIRMADSKPGGYGKITLQRVMEKSSNIGVAKTVTKYFGASLEDQEEFIRYLDDFGLTQPLDFQLKGSAKPEVKRPGNSNWSKISLPWMSIGYGIEMSPLQMAGFYNALANGGRFVKPRIVKEIKEGNRVIESFPVSYIKNKICSERTANYLKDMLVGVVENGTAANIKSEEYKIAGKTGTAKKLINGRYTSEYYSSFAGFFPADNPRYTIVVTVDNPQRNGYYGSEVAAPIFKKISDVIYNSELSLHQPIQDKYIIDSNSFPRFANGYTPDMIKVAKHLRKDIIAQEDVESDDIHKWGKMNQKNDSLLVSAIDYHKDKVPDVRGMYLKDALYLLENIDLHVRINGRGIVQSQSLPIGATVVPGDKITLNLTPLNAN
jgi:cell division protein FtsI (penicillin-binding protein 3)